MRPQRWVPGSLPGSDSAIDSRGPLLVKRDVPQMSQKRLRKLRRKVHRFRKPCSRSRANEDTTRPAPPTEIVVDTHLDLQLCAELRPFLPAIVMSIASRNTGDRRHKLCARVGKCWRFSCVCAACGLFVAPTRTFIMQPSQATKAAGQPSSRCACDLPLIFLEGPRSACLPVHEPDFRFLPDASGHV